jgi:hypothetical protein
MFRLLAFSIVLMSITGTSWGQCGFFGNPPDSDGDGYCDDVDQYPNDPCAIFDPCDNCGGDNDGDGVCANDDPDDNDPNNPNSQGGGESSTTPDVGQLLYGAAADLANAIILILLAWIIYRLIRMVLAWFMRGRG